MHEYPLTLNIIDIASRYARKKDKSYMVSTIHLVIGESSGILGESIRLYFDDISQGTPCEGAEIEIEWIKPMLKCKACGQLFHRRPFSFACPQEGCDGEGEPTEIGREFYVKEIVLKHES